MIFKTGDRVRVTLGTIPAIPATVVVASADGSMVLQLDEAKPGHVVVVTLMDAGQGLRVAMPGPISASVEPIYNA